ncbi:MAG: hypothetical protein IJ752_09045 [Alphaproteobacteria bacterium]|nr:hypothetical protein [Alphaproteobacteria bacterium]
MADTENTVDETPVTPEAPEQEAPAQEAPEQETPAQEAPEQEAPAQEAPEQEAPAQEAPEQEAPAQEGPEQEAPAQEAPEQEAPAQEGPEQEASAQEAPEQETPSQEAPEQETPSQEGPEQETPSQETPEQETPSQEGPEQETPSQDNEVVGELEGIEPPSNTATPERSGSLKDQLWNTAWKNKFMGYESDPCPFTQCKPDTIKKHLIPPHYSMELKSGSKLKNYRNKVGLTYEGNTPKFEDCMTAVRLAKEKGWTGAKLKGPEEYKQQMYLAMRAQGLEPIGYTPSPELLKEGDRIAAEYAEARAKAEQMDARYPALNAARQNLQQNYSQKEAFEKLDSATYDLVARTAAHADQNQTLNEQQTPAPEQQTPAPEQPTPAPEQPTPAPEQPTPAPEQPTPAPEQPTPAPEQPTPAPEQPTPAPEQPTPAPEQPTPAPEQPTPAPEQPTPAPEPEQKKVSQNMREVLSEMSRTTGVNMAIDGQEAVTKMSRGFKSLPKDLQDKFGKMVTNMVENHPEVAKQLIRDLNSDGKQGPARVMKAYGKALNSIREAEAKGEKTTTRLTDKQKQDMTNKIISGLKKNTR